MRSSTEILAIWLEGNVPGLRLFLARESLQGWRGGRDPWRLCVGPSSGWLLGHCCAPWLWKIKKLPDMMGAICPRSRILFRMSTITRHVFLNTRLFGRLRKTSAISHTLGTGPHTKFEWTPRTIFAAALACMVTSPHALPKGAPFPAKLRVRDTVMRMHTNFVNFCSLHLSNQ